MLILMRELDKAIRLVNKSSLGFNLYSDFYSRWYCSHTLLHLNIRLLTHHSSYVVMICFRSQRESNPGHRDDRWAPYHLYKLFRCFFYFNFISLTEIDCIIFPWCYSIYFNNNAIRIWCKYVYKCRVYTYMISILGTIL